MTTETADTGAQNTEALAATTEDTGSEPTPRADMAEKLFGDNKDEGAAGDDEAKGDEGNEDGSTSDEDPSKQDEKPDDKESDSEDGDKKDEESKGAPEEYEDFAMPEGVEISEEAAGELKTLAKELNLSQKDAQRIADLGAKQAARLAEQPSKVLAEARTEWEKQSRTDKEFGGKNVDTNLGVAKKAMDAYGTPELKTLLRESALGNHPEVIRFMFRVGKAISEDTMVRGKGADTPKAKSHAEVLYGDNN